MKPGGRIAYVTCSLLADENDTQISAFLSRHQGFAVVAPTELTTALAEQAAAFRAAVLLSEFGLLMTPRRTGTDAFFVSVLRRA